MDVNTIKMVEYNLKNMVVNPAIVIIAKRGSGKSFLTRDILYHLRGVPSGMIISSTEKKSPLYVDFFPDLFIHYEITDNLLSKLLMRQDLICEKEKKKAKKGKKIDPRAILVMDDCLSKKGAWAKDQSILEIMMNGRHYKLTYILIMQYMLGITPELRTQFDYIFLLRENIATSKKKLYDHYAGMFPTYSIFETVFKACTDDYGCMVIDNREPKDLIEEQVFWYKAKVPPEFHFGSKKFRIFNKDYYDPKFLKNSRRQTYNINTVQKKSGVPNFIVKKVENDK
jgi:hypothetical protein